MTEPTDPIEPLRIIADEYLRKLNDLIASCDLLTEAQRQLALQEARILFNDVLELNNIIDAE